MKDLFKYFRGAWHFNRKIFTPGKEVLYATASGRACFEDTAAERSLILNENGKLILEATQTAVTFYKSFAYTFSGNGVTVYFNDGADAGKLYQEYTYDAPVQQLNAICKHICIRDVYDALYQITDDDHFCHQSIIKGPEKDMYIETLFTRKTA